MREPRAEFRQTAQQAHEMFVAFRMEGFNEPQAMALVAHMLGGH
jgi:hypothetical protein